MFLRQFRLIDSGRPSYLSSFLVRGRSVRSAQFAVPQFDLAVGKKTLFVQGIIDWNLIPVKIRMASSVKIFRDQCVEFFNRSSNPTIYE